LRSDLRFRTCVHARAACAIILVLSCASAASAQLLAAKDGPVVYGHHHIAASDIPAHLKFFADTLGGARIKFGPQQVDVVKFPNVFIFFRNQKPTGGSKGTTVNHIGFSVTNLRETLNRVKAGGYAIITRSEVAPTQQVVDDIAPVNATTSIAFVDGTRRCESGARGATAADNADRAPSRPLLRSAEQRDARVVREGLRREASRRAARSSSPICPASR
jgi:predicted enzyme related to lactoylglutathione lyase